MTVELARLGTALERLDHFWRSQGAPVGELAKPGLTDEEIDTLIDPLGLRLPTEARLWWGWHNGVHTTAEIRHPIGLSDRIGIGAWTLPSLENAIADYRMRCKIHAGDWEFYERSWFPVVTSVGGDTIVVDCATAESDLTPVRTVFKGDIEPHTIKAASLTQVIEWWVDLFDQGICRWSNDTNAWLYDEQRIDPALRRTELV